MRRARATRVNRSILRLRKTLALRATRQEVLQSAFQSKCAARRIIASVSFLFPSRVGHPVCMPALSPEGHWPKHGIRRPDSKRNGSVWTARKIRERMPLEPLALKVLPDLAVCEHMESRDGISEC
jgi:hypothetical protein